MSTGVSLKPVSGLLTKQLMGSVHRGLRVWLDINGDFTAFVDALAEQNLGFPVVRWRQSYIETLVGLRDVVSGVDNQPALLHVPHHNKDSILASPLLEFYRAGKLYEKNLHTLIEEAAAGLVTPTDIQAFLGSDDVSLDRADSWLEEHAIVAQGGIDARLTVMVPELLIAQLYNPDEELLGALKAGSVQLEHLWGHLHRTFGLDNTWRAFAYQAPSGLDAERSWRIQCQAIGFTAVSWCLSVEYVHDLKRPPFVDALLPLTKLSRPLIESARAVAESLRDRKPDLYETVVDEFEPKLEQERQDGDARELGKVDTFRFEQRRVMEAALEALGSGSFDDVRDWAENRRAERSFWVRRDKTRDAAWRLVAHAAELGALIDANPRPLRGAVSLPEAVDLYVEHGSSVDRAHRMLEQRRSSLLTTQLPLYSKIRIRLDELRSRYRHWANTLAVDFNQLCLDQGFKPTESLQQRHIFDQEIREHALALNPNSDPPVAFFMVDALRYEMAEELLEDLREASGVELTLQARLAELPTITAVGMNALAPVTQSGLLHPVMKDGAFMGFRTREFQVTRPSDRQHAMRHRVGGRTSPEVTLREVIDDSVSTLRRRIAQASLLIVKSRELDDSGEKGLGLVTFENTLRRLREAVERLREAGVCHFVFSADHGFLLLDQTAARGAIGHAGKKTGVDRRHIVYPANTKEAGRVTVSLSGLGYAGVEGFLILPEDTSIFDRGARNQLFVHGGNSPQERIIPVMQVRFKSRVSESLSRFKLDVGSAQGVVEFHALTVRVEQIAAQGALPMGNAREVDVALRPVLPDGEHAPRVEVELADVRGGELRGGTIRVSVGAQAEIFFKLISDEKVPKVEVEAYAPTRRAGEVQPARSVKRFGVARLGASPASRPTPVVNVPEPVAPEDEQPQVGTGEDVEPPAKEVVPVVEIPPSFDEKVAVDEPFGGEPSEVIEYGGWEDLPRDGTQQIFEHIARHGMITEAEATKMLGGSGRQFRRFSRRIDEYISRVSFDVRVEVIGGTKRYVLEKG